MPARERSWFDDVWRCSSRSQASELSTTDILHDFVRALWAEALKRRRGALPASGDDAAAEERLRLTADVKRLSSARWNTVKDIVRQYLNQ